MKHPLSLFMCVACVCILLHMQRAEGDAECPALPFPALLPSGSLTLSRVRLSFSKPQQSSCLCSSSLGVRGTHAPVPGFHVSAGDFNSGHHACTVSTINPQSHPLAPQI